jgi:hypothetical protein
MPPARTSSAVSRNLSPSPVEPELTTEVFAGNHTNTERPWLAFFAPRLRAAINEAASSDGRKGVKYEVVLSKEDKEPLQVV